MFGIIPLSELLGARILGLLLPHWNWSKPAKQGITVAREYYPHALFTNWKWFGFSAWGEWELQFGDLRI